VLAIAYPLGGSASDQPSTPAPATNFLMDVSVANRLQGLFRVQLLASIPARMTVSA